MHLPPSRRPAARRDAAPARPRRPGSVWLRRLRAGSRGLNRYTRARLRQVHPQHPVSNIYTEMGADSRNNPVRRVMPRSDELMQNCSSNAYTAGGTGVAVAPKLGRLAFWCATEPRCQTTLPHRGHSATGKMFRALSLEPGLVAGITITPTVASTHDHSMPAVRSAATGAPFLAQI